MEKKGKSEIHGYGAQGRCEKTEAEITATINSSKAERSTKAPEIHSADPQ